MCWKSRCRVITPGLDIQASERYSRKRSIRVCLLRIGSNLIREIAVNVCLNHAINALVKPFRSASNEVTGSLTAVRTSNRTIRSVMRAFSRARHVPAKVSGKRNTVPVRLNVDRFIVFAIPSDQRKVAPDARHLQKPAIFR